MEGSLLEVIGNQIILNSLPPTLFLNLYIFLMKPMLTSIFQQAIKFEYQFLDIFQSYFFNL